jgi:hypothetical protein
MSGTVPVNGQVLRQRLLDLGLSDRRAAALVGIGQATVRSMTADGTLGGHMAVSVLRRLLDETGLAAGDLLDTPAASPEAPPSGEDERPARPGAARGHPDAPPRTARHGPRLDPGPARSSHHRPRRRARTAGLKVHVNSMGVTLRPSDGGAAEAVRRLQAAREVAEGLDNGDVRLLRRALLGDLPQAARPR